jgi:DNA-binding NarL/FixJ family response regulator
VRVLVADDDVHVRSALRLLLEQEPDVQIVAESAAAEELLSAVTDSGAGLVLLDWELPGLWSDGVIGSLLTRLPRVKLIALSGRPEHRHEALRAGADAFVCKGDAPDDLLVAVRLLDKDGAANDQGQHDPVDQVSR